MVVDRCNLKHTAAGPDHVYSNYSSIFWKMRRRIGDCSIQGCLSACRMGAVFPLRTIFRVFVCPRQSHEFLTFSAVAASHATGKTLLKCQQMFISHRNGSLEYHVLVHLFQRLHKEFVCSAPMTVWMRHRHQAYESRLSREYNRMLRCTHPPKTLSLPASCDHTTKRSLGCCRQAG